MDDSARLFLSRRLAEEDCGKDKKMETVIGLFKRYEGADRAVEAWEFAGFPEGSSVVSRDKAVRERVERVEQSDWVNDLAVGAGAGAVSGALAGGVAGIFIGAMGNLGSGTALAAAVLAIALKKSPAKPPTSPPLTAPAPAPTTKLFAQSLCSTRSTHS